MCTVFSDATISGVLQIPPKTVATFSKNVEFSAKSSLVMAFSSRLVARGTIEIKSDSSLVISDDRRRIPEGKYELIEGSSISGMFGGTWMKKSMIVGRLFFCMQIPKLKMIVERDKVVAQFTKLGASCVSPLFSMPLLFCAVGLIAYFLMFGRTEKLEEKKV